MNIKRIVPNIPSSNIEKSKQFYRDFLGLKLAMAMDWILTFVSESNPAVQITVLQNDQIQKLKKAQIITEPIKQIDSL